MVLELRYEDLHIPLDKFPKDLPPLKEATSLFSFPIETGLVCNWLKSFDIL